MDEFNRDVGRTSQRDAPALADISRRIEERMPWFADQPLEVDGRIFELARQEMAAIQKHRGFPIAVAPLQRSNFLLRGVTIVSKDEE